MSALFMDGFDHYGSGARSIVNMLAGPYASISNTSACGVPSWGASRTGTGCLKNGGNEQGLNRRVLPAAKTHLFVSFGLAVDSLFNTPNQTQYNAISFLDNASATIFILGWTTTGAIHLLDGSNNVLGTTSGPVIRPEDWQFLEMEVNTSAHTFKLRVDDPTGTDTPVLDITNAAITGSMYSLGLLPIFTNSDLAVGCFMDDLFVRDSSGSINNGWLGDRRVATLYANADTAEAGWTPTYYKKFGSGILNLATVETGLSGVQGINSYVFAGTSSSLDIGGSDFTLETMIRFDALPDATHYGTIFGRWDAAGNQRSYRLIYGGSSFNNNCIQFDTSTDGSSGTVSTPIVFPWVPTLNTWYHIAMVRAAGELLLFVNGEQFGLPIVDSSVYFGGGTELISVGTEIAGTGGGTVVNNSYLAGRLDETRFTNGTGRYTGPFSPPVAAFPRGVSDPHWAQVVWLMGYDGSVTDESSFARSSFIGGSAADFIPSDGPLVGEYSTVNKAVPDDNTFISAALVNATNLLTMTSQPANGNTITLGTSDGSTPAVYTFKNTITTAFDVLIDTTAQNTLINFLNAVNAGPGAGVKYGTATTSNFDVNAVQLPVGQIEVIANLAGTGGNSIPSTRTGTAAVWASATLTGGAAIPGISAFKFQRPPNNTTIISALQTNVRASKTDAGTATIQTTFEGALGGTAPGVTHNLTISGNYYADMVETDPDTMGPLSPTTIINGILEINRTA